MLLWKPLEMGRRNTFLVDPRVNQIKDSVIRTWIPLSQSLYQLTPEFMTHDAVYLTRVHCPKMLIPPTVRYHTVFAGWPTIENHQRGETQLAYLASSLSITSPDTDVSSHHEDYRVQQNVTNNNNLRRKEIRIEPEMTYAATQVPVAAVQTFIESKDEVHTILIMPI
ncbi:hypothetical protein BLNAU_22330 [Blattamonas nauphoetae]|uniref:Uncharacterized protein n=1 Tax=Blattamonas nauphoetae TaxID=2049346 RepID=A0ABQ9WTB1_9EUKA|nr:hypothetical protein BLNAU_22330 [Blattamonas nauphoetae]